MIFKLQLQLTRFSINKQIEIIMENSRTKTRYNDDELEEFRQIILTKLEDARADLKLLVDAFTNHNENGTNDTSPSFKVLEEGNMVRSKEENAQMAGRQQKFIKSLENALVRIDNKTYGVCRETGNLISKERLRSVPHATLSIDAKLRQGK